MQDGFEVLQLDAVGEVAGGGGGAAVAELGLDSTQIVGGFPDVFGEGAAKVVDAELGADAETFFEARPLLEHAGILAGTVPGLRSGAKQVDDGLVAVGEGGEGVEDASDGGCDGQGLVGVAFGGEAQGARGCVVVGEAHTGGGAVADPEVAAEHEEEFHWRSRGVEESSAFIIRCNNCSRLRLVDAADGAGDGERGLADFFEPAEKSAKAFGVGGASVLRVVRPLRLDRGDTFGGETRGAFATELGDDGRERGTRVGILLVGLEVFESGPRDGARRCLGFVSCACRRILAWCSLASRAVSKALRRRVPVASLQSARNLPHFFCMVSFRVLATLVGLAG